MKKVIPILLCLLLLCGCDAPAAGPGLTTGRPGTESLGAPSNPGSIGTSIPASTAAPETVAQPLSSLAISPDCAKAMDPANYFGEAVTFDEAWSITGWWEFSGDTTAYEAVKAYVTLLTEQYDFQLVAQPYEHILESSHYTMTDFEFTLDYAGQWPLEEDLNKGEHTKLEGDIVITGNITVDDEKSQGLASFDVRFNTNLKIIDEGYRFGGEKITRYYCGDSFGAGLLRNPDGSFETSDGRLKASVGETMLLHDGKAAVHTTLFNLNSKSEIQEIVVANGLDIYQVAFAFPITRTLTSGTVYDEFDLYTEEMLEEPYENLTEGTPDLRNEGFHILRGERYYVPQQGMMADFKQLNMRIMYVDADYSVAVIYFCADFGSKPNRTEGLIAVQLNAPNGGMSNGNATVYNMKVGQELQIEGPYESSSMYNLHRWSFVSGSEFCEMHNTKLQTVKIIAHGPGTVRIKVEHEYTEEVYDTILGRPSDEPTKATQEYVIYIGE